MNLVDWVQQGDKLRLFPSMTQYGWCFVVDVKDNTRRGWVPGGLAAGVPCVPFAPLQSRQQGMAFGSC